MRYVSGTKLDERIVRCDLDAGYSDGRQFGRGKSGGQVRDEHRQDYDAGRGGWGAQVQMEKRKEREELYADVQHGSVPAGGGGDWKAGPYHSLPYILTCFYAHYLVSHQPTLPTRLQQNALVRQPTRTKTTEIVQ